MEKELNKKMNWGTGIIIMLVVFMIGLFVMVFIAVSQRVDLVTQNYYEKELVYQEEIDKLERAKALPQELTIHTGVEGIIVQFPENSIKSNLQGTVHLYRPSNSSLDRQYSVKVDTLSRMLIPYTGLYRGKWTVKVDWKMDEVSYLSIKEILLN